MLKIVLLSALFAVALAVIPENPDAEFIEKCVVKSADIIPEFMDLDDVLNKDIKYKPLLITYNGELDLQKGQFTKINTYATSGNIKDLGSGIFEVPLKFSRVDFQYQYDVIVDTFPLSIKNDGQVNGIVRDYELTLSIQVVDGKYQLTRSPSFHIPKVDLDFSGRSMLADLLFELLEKTFIDIVKQVNEQEYAYELAKLIVEKMNEAAATL